MKKLIIVLLLVLMSNQALAGVKGSVGYEFTQNTTTQVIPYTVCTPVCQAVTNTYKHKDQANTLRLNLGYEQRISGPVSVDLIGSTNVLFDDLRLESNLKVDLNDNLSIKGGVNRLSKKSGYGINYEPGMGYQAGLEYKLPSQGEVNPFVDVKYYRMNQNYTIDGSNSSNNIKSDAVSIGIGLTF